MNYEFMVPGERIRHPEYVYRVAVPRQVMAADYPYDPAEYLPPVAEEWARAVVCFNDGRVIVRLEPTPYTVAVVPKILLRALMPVPPGRHEAHELLSAALRA